MSDQHDRPTGAPTAGRPRMPEGYGVPAGTEDLLSWSVANERLEQAQNYWVCTASREGKPHAAPVWGVWLDNRLYFDGHPETRWARNLIANPQMSLHLENGTEVVIIEGVVESVDHPGPEIYTPVADAYEAKYKYRPPDHGFFLFRPRVAIAWTQFPKDATRWRFESEKGGV